MSTFEDDEDADAATTWAGDADTSLAAGRRGDDDIAPAAATDAAAKQSMPSFLLVAYGVLAGAYLLYTVGWLVALQRFGALRAPSTDVLVEAMTQLGFVFAMASPLLWFLTTWTVTRGRRHVVRFLWIVVGLLVVLPWPFVWGVWS